MLGEGWGVSWCEGRGEEGRRGGGGGRTGFETWTVMFVPRVTSVPVVGDMMKAFWARAALGRREARRESVSVVNFIVCGWWRCVGWWI